METLPKILSFAKVLLTPRNRTRLTRSQMMMMMLCIFILIIDLSEARGKKKKKRPSAGGGSGPTCQSLGLDCSDTCCTGSECAETKLDCAMEFKRPFQELYIGFGTVVGITVGVSVIIGIINFCLMFKFCQTYDENLDTYVGGFSICDAISCLLTCGLIYR